MTLFKFGECEVCKQKCNDAKLFLHQFLPEDVCEKLANIISIASSAIKHLKKNKNLWKDMMILTPMTM